MRKGLAVFNDVSAPVNTALPSINGDPAPKKNLACGSGTWSSDASVTYSYSWARNGVTIGQAQGSTYTVTSDDAGQTLTCAVTASNFAGSTSVTSASVSVTGGTPLDSGGSSGGSDGPTTGTSSCKTRGKIISKSLRRALASGKIRVKVVTDKTGSTANLHLRADGVGAKLAARQNVTFSNGLTTKRVTMKLRPRAKRELRRRVNKKDLWTKKGRHETARLLLRLRY